MWSSWVIRMRLEEFIRPKHTNVWPCKGRLLRCLAYKRKMEPVLKPHNSVCPRVCQESDLSRAGLLGVGRIGLVDLP